MLLLGMANPAPAHQNTRAYGDLELSKETARLTLFIRFADWDEPLKLDLDRDGTITRAELQPSAPAIERILAEGVSGWSGPDPCPMTVNAPAVAVRHGQAYVMSPITFGCPGPIRTFTLRYNLFSRIHPGHGLFARVRVAETETTRVLITDPDQPAEYTAEVTRNTMLLRTIASFVSLGLRHIVTGYDHVAFLLAIVVAGGTLKQLVKVVTAFTLAHSVTLALAALDVVRPPGRAVEAIIALSIVAVAAENLAFKTGPSAWRTPLTFLFGLVHGFGFAGALAEMNLARGSLLTALLCFNLGIEAGQLLMVALLYPGLLWLWGRTFRLQVIRAVSIVILALGLGWLVERTILPAFSALTVGPRAS